MGELRQIGGVLPAIQRPAAGHGTLPSTTALPASLEATRGWLERAVAAGMETIPPDVVAGLPAAVAEAEAALAPASPQAFAVTIKRLTDYVEAFGLPAPAPSAAAAVYREALGDLPAELLAEAVTRTVRTHKFHVLPKPGEIRATVAEDLAKLHLRRHMARRAAIVAGLTV